MQRQKFISLISWDSAFSKNSLNVSTLKYLCHVLAQIGPVYRHVLDSKNYKNGKHDILLDCLLLEDSASFWSVQTVDGRKGQLAPVGDVSWQQAKYDRQLQPDRNNSTLQPHPSTSTITGSVTSRHSAAATAEHGEDVTVVAARRRMIVTNKPSTR